MGRKTNSTPSFIESYGLFITKPFDVANYFNDYFHRIHAFKTNNERTTLQVPIFYGSVGDVEKLFPKERYWEW